MTPTYTYFITDSTTIDATSVPAMAPVEIDDCANLCIAYRFDVHGK